MSERFKIYTKQEALEIVTDFMTNTWKPEGVKIIPNKKVWAEGNKVMTFLWGMTGESVVRVDMEAER